MHFCKFNFHISLLLVEWQCSIIAFLVSSLVYSGYCAATRIVQVFETCVPCQCFGCRTCDTWYTRYAFGCRRTGEVFFENTTVVIFFFVLWRIDRETFCCMLHFLVADSGCCNCFQGVNPRISHSVGELLFLSPCYTLWQKRSKGITYDTFFDGMSPDTFLQPGSGAWLHPETLCRGTAHDLLHPMQKVICWHAAVVQVEFGELADSFFVEGFRCRGFMEVKVTSEYFIGSFTT